MCSRHGILNVQCSSETHCVSLSQSISSALISMSGNLLKGNRILVIGLTRTQTAMDNGTSDLVDVARPISNNDSYLRSSYLDSRSSGMVSLVMDIH